jgi:hypothetical protein
MAADVVALTKARSMLLILLATCQQTLLALDATDNALVPGTADELQKMVERAERDLKALTAKLDSLK